METMRRSHLYEQLPSTHYEVSEYEYPRNIDYSPSVQLLPPNKLSLSEDGSLASGVAARSLKPSLLSSQLSGQSQNYQSPAYRRRENPLYQSFSHIDAKSSNSRPCDCIFIFSLVLTLFACLVSFISIGIAIHTNKVTVNHTHVEDLEAQMKSVLLKYELLVKQVHEIKQDEIQSLENKYELTMNRSLDIQDEIYQKFSKLRADIGQQIKNVSKMPGHFDAPGLANMSACKYTVKSAGGASAIAETLTSWIPGNRDEANRNVITGVECSATNGLAAFLLTSDNSGFVQFRCRCFGSEHKNATSRYCIMHYWSCPVDN